MKRYKANRPKQVWSQSLSTSRSRVIAALRPFLQKIIRPGARFSIRAGKGAYSTADIAGQRSRRTKKILARLVLISLLILAIGSGGIVTFQLLGYSDIFRITSVTIRGNRMTKQHQIYEIADLKNKTSMLHLDIDKIASNIAQQPWIDKVEIKRDWPSSVIINVTEHRPLALVNTGAQDRQRLFYVDQSGTLFAPVMTARDIDFPVITGSPHHLQVQNHEITKATPAKEALELLRLARKSVVLPVQSISEIHIDEKEELILYLVDRPFPIYLGRDGMKKKFRRLITIIQDLYRKKEFEKIAEIRMDYGENKILVAKTDS